MGGWFYPGSGKTFDNRGPKPVDSADDEGTRLQLQMEDQERAQTVDQSQKTLVGMNIC